MHPYTGHTAGDENTPCGRDINAYTRTTIRAADIVQSFRGRLMVTIICPGVVPCGPGDRLGLPGLVDALSRGIYAHVDAGRTRVCLRPG